jgi:hypothetical protein
LQRKRTPEDGLPKIKEKGERERKGKACRHKVEYTVIQMMDERARPFPLFFRAN